MKKIEENPESYSPYDERPRQANVRPAHIEYPQQECTEAEKPQPTFKKKRKKLNVPFIIVFVLMIFFFFAWLLKPSVPISLTAVESIKKAEDERIAAKISEQFMPPTEAPKTSTDNKTFISKLSNGGGIISESGVTFQFSKPEDFPDASTDAGERKIGVYTEIKNGSDTTISIDTYAFKIKTSNGEIMNETYLSVMLDDKKDLRDVKLSPGGKTEGYLAFDVPENDKGLSLLFYENPYWDEDPAFEIKLFE